jgi:ethanolamine permease
MQGPPSPPHALARTLTPLHLWALGVGLVVSGEYFGWNYGWPLAGTVGFLLCTGVVAVLYVTLVLSLVELSTAMPEAGGVFHYAERAFGRTGAVVAAVAGLTEFLFAPPAIAFALGGYLHALHPGVPITGAALAGLVVFGGVNLLAVRASTRLEVFITIVAVVELLLFVAVLAPHFRWSSFAREGLRGGVPGIFAALPFAIWLFLGIEGLALAAEEVVDPPRHLPRGFLSAMATLVFLALAVMLAAGGVGDWQRLTDADFPVPKAVELALGAGNPWARAFAGIGLFGLLASLHGIVFGASRQLFAVARAGLLPPGLLALNRFAAPHRAVLVATGVGVAAVLSGRTPELITLAGLGAVTLYLLATASLFVLRVRAPELPRPFRVPLHPLVPGVALTLSVIALLAMGHSAPRLAALFGALVAAGLAASRRPPRRASR